VVAEPGETVVITLTVRNAGSVPDRYEPDIAPDVARRIGLDRSGPAELQPGEQRVWTVVYTVGPDAGSAADDRDTMFGLGGIDDGGGSAYEDPGPVTVTVGVPIRVVSVSDPRVAACARFGVRVPAAGAGTIAGGPAGPYDDPYDDDPRDDRRRKMRNTGAVVATVVAVVAAILVGMAVAGTGDDKSPAARSTPGTSVSASADETSEAGAGDTATEGASETGSASPSASTGTRVTVPDVVGMTKAQGLAALRAEGLKPTTTGSGDRIASTDPAAGAKVDRKKPTVTVTLTAATPTATPTTTTASSAPAPSSSPGPVETVPGPDAPPAPEDRLVKVPDVAGLTYLQAQARLMAQGFMVGRVDEISTKAVGTVLRASPGAGAKAARGTRVTVTVAKADDTMTTVPRIKGLRIAAARDALHAAGLVFEPKYENYDPNSWCTPHEFTPGEGERVPRGTVIDVTRVYGCG